MPRNGSRENNPQGDLGEVINIELAPEIDPGLSVKEKNAAGIREGKDLF